MSSYQFNQLSINPAYTGVNDITSFDIHYRSQWNGLEGAPNTVYFAGTTSIIENKVGFGFSILQDNAGITNSTRMLASFAYELDLSSEVTLSFGLQTGTTWFNYSYNELLLEDPTDEDFITPDSKQTAFIIGSGLFLSASNFYLGLSIPNMLTTPESTTSNGSDLSNRHYYLSGGIIFDQIPNIKLKPYMLLRIAENTPVLFDLGTDVQLVKVLWVGLFTRSFNSLGLTASVNLINGLRMGYVGEVGFADEAPSTGLTTNELTIGIDLALFNKQTITSRNY
jgi:type IX secretion system PorP/SprF family membrane protein